MLFAELNVFDVLGKLMYLVLALIAMWGAFCVVMVWNRVREKRFRNEDAASGVPGRCWTNRLARAILTRAGRDVGGGQASDVAIGLAGDRQSGHRLSEGSATAGRPVPTRRAGRPGVPAQLGQHGDQERPMVGLLGTVMGMMGAFKTLATQENVKPDQLAGDISFALVTTACGLAIAIPLLLATASINVRIRKMEDLVAAGLTRFLECFPHGFGHWSSSWQLSNGRSTPTTTSAARDLSGRRG